MAKATSNYSYFKHEVIMRYARLLGFGELHTKIDSSTGLNAVIAIHNTTLGPAIGGTRCFHYSSAGSAIIDALKLAYTMTLKAAVADLPHGGAKAVLLKPKKIKDRKAYFQSYGDFVHEMNGRYITAVDVGTTEEDMDIIAERTPYVFGTTASNQGDPSPMTAQGVVRGIQAAVKYKLNRDNLEDIHVAIQGAGHVGYYMAKLLHKLGAKITVADPKPKAVTRLKEEFNASQASIEEIYDIKCDVFSPCALSNTINYETINRIKAPIIAGSANAQLAHQKFAELMRQKNILYAPDFVINAGGLIFAAMVYDTEDMELANTKIDNLYDILLNIFELADQTGKTTADIAVKMAKDKLSQKKIYDEDLIGS